MASCISAFFSGLFARLGFYERPDGFKQDLHFIKTTILENHPGIYNDLDPNFASEMLKSCQIAEQQLNQAHSPDEKTLVLENFGRSFQDAHLWVKYDSTKVTQVANKKTPSTFSIHKLLDNVSWIKIPTFDPSKNQIASLQEIINALPQLREETIIFDLRGNGGGNSYWGIELLKALCGESYLDHCFTQKNQNVYVEWRASPGNLEHVRGFVPTFKEKFGKDHPSVIWAEATYQRMAEAIAFGNHYYSDQQLPHNSSQSVGIVNPFVNAFKGQAIAIVDRKCGSSCLDFLDYLKATQPNVVLVGEPTGADSTYMELRTIQLPSGKGFFGFPIKVYRNRPRGHNIPHLPNINYNEDLQDTATLQKFILTMYGNLNLDS